MRQALLSAVVLLAACGQGAPPTPAPGADPVHPADASVPAALPGARLDTVSVTGSWSFDRTCATEDAMGLMSDGKVYFDEWGEGTWVVDADGRLVLTLRELTPGGDPKTSAPFTLTLTADAPATEDLAGTLVSIRADMPARRINAKRCPETPPQPN